MRTFNHRFLAFVVLLGGSPLAAIADEDQEQGKAVFEQWCWQCHGQDNPHGSGSWALAKRPGDTRSPYLEERSFLSADYVKFVVRQGQLFMPKFRYTEISEEELAALAAYLATNEDNQSQSEDNDLE